MSQTRKETSSPSSDYNDTATDMEMSNSPVSSTQIGSANVVVGAPTATNWSLVSSTVVGPPAAFPPPVLADPSILMLLSHYGQFGFIPAAADPSGLLVASGTMDSVPTPPKNIVQLTNAVLYPPSPTAPTPPLRLKPPGCRTIFVGGLPEKCTEEILRELFERCGELQSVRMSKKNFAHIRFIDADNIEKALYFSGYRLKIEDRSEKEFTGRLHVDYAQARDDQHEWELQQRLALREQRQRERSSSPTVPTVHYTEHEASSLLEKLKASDGFDAASSTLVAWLDKGNCNKRSSTQFYSLIAAVNAHVRRLLQDKIQYDAEMVSYKEKYNQRLQSIMMQFDQIEKVFRAARKQKNWDHFSKGQRKNLDGWLKQAEELRKAHENQMINNREEEEMETSDDEGCAGEDGDVRERSPKRIKFDPSEFYQRQAEELRAENNVLKARLVLFGHATEAESFDDLHCNENDLKDRLTETEEKLNNALKTVADQESKISKLEQELDGVVSTSTSNGGRLDTNDAELIAIVANFLNVHPLGASVDYLWSYLSQIMNSIKSSEIEGVLEKFPEIFKRKECGIGANYERKWFFVGYENCKKKM